MSAREVSNSDDIIDSRDIIARIKELEDEKDSLEADIQEAKFAKEDVDNQVEDADHELASKLGEREEALAAWVANYGDELKSLKALEDEAEGYSEDWRYGATLIRESYFTQYAQDFADDIGRIDNNAEWPNNHIDWEEAAEDLKHDYTEVDFDGVTYYVR